MKSQKFFFNVTLMLILGGFLLLCFLLCDKKQPIEPDKPCINDQPVEDTTRVYLWPISRDTLEIYPPMVYARFYPWVQDTIQIKQLAEKHHLRLRLGPGLDYGQLAAWLCVTDDRRAEYHFTPYGKTGFCNFGTDSLVEYAFGVFNNGGFTFDGTIDFRFVDDTPQARIDSLFAANGLRFLFTVPDFPTGKWHLTLVTPRAKKNVLDLAYELQRVPFARTVDPGFYGAHPPLNCDDDSILIKSKFTYNYLKSRRRL